MSNATYRLQTTNNIQKYTHEKVKITNYDQTLKPWSK